MDSNELLKIIGDNKDKLITLFLKSYLHVNPDKWILSINHSREISTSQDARFIKIPVLLSKQFRLDKTQSRASMQHEEDVDSVYSVDYNSSNNIFPGRTEFTFHCDDIHYARPSTDEEVETIVKELKSRQLMFSRHEVTRHPISVYINFKNEIFFRFKGSYEEDKWKYISNIDFDKEIVVVSSATEVCRPSREKLLCNHISTIEELSFSDFLSDYGVVYEVRPKLLNYQHLLDDIEYSKRKNDHNQSHIINHAKESIERSLNMYLRGVYLSSENKNEPTHE